MRYFRFVSLIACLLATATSLPAHAQLVVQASGHVLQQNSPAGVVVEASSTHLAIVFVYPNIAMHRTEARAITLSPGQPTSFLSNNDVISNAILDSQGGIASVIASIRRDDWGFTETSIGAGTKADLRVVFQADPKDIQSFADILFQQLHAGSSILERLKGKTTSIDGYNALGTELLTQLATNLKLAPVVNSTGGKGPLPKQDQYATPLGWLYKFGLDHEYAGRLRGCTFPDTHRVSAETLAKTEGTAAELYRQFVVQSRELSIAGLVPTYFSSKSAVNFVAKTWERHNQYLELMAFRAIDPAVVPILQCKAWRLLDGDQHPTQLVIERSQIYAAASKRISDLTQGKGPRFFSAAQAVTRLFGLGLVDAADLYGLEDGGVRERFGQLLALRNGCIGDGAIIPKPGERKLLREVNLELFQKVNLPIMRRLVKSPQMYFDPRQKPRPGQRDRALHVPEGFSKSLAFDLRMVEAEQTFVESKLKERNFIASSNADKDLTRSLQALECLDFDSFIVGAGAGGKVPAHFQQIELVKGLVQQLAAEGLIERGDAVFSNYFWRVALGTAYVFSLHFDGTDPQEWESNYKSYFRRLIKEMAQPAPVPELPPMLQDQMERILKEPSPSIGDDTKSNLASALESFLDPLPSQSLFYDCGASGFGFSETTTTVSPGPSPARSFTGRVSYIGNKGPGILATAYELQARGGALNDAVVGENGSLLPAFQLSSLPLERRGMVCSALEERRRLLDCVIGKTTITSCLLPAFIAGDDKRLLIFDQSRDLRAALGILAPYLVIELQSLGPVTSFSRDDAELTAEKTINAAQRHLSDIALLGILSRQDVATLRKLGISSTPTEIKAIFDSTQPYEGDASSLSDQAGRAVYLNKFGVAGRAKRIQETAEKVAIATKQVRDRFSPSKIASHIGSAPTDLEAPATNTGPAIHSAGPSGTDGRSRGLAGGLGVGETGLTFELAETLSSSDGTQRFAATLVFIRERATNAAVATINCVQEKLPTGAPRCPVSDRPVKASQQIERIPLGLQVSPVVLGQNGALAAAASLGDADIDFDVEEARRGLYALGLPRFLLPKGLKVNVSKDLSSVSMELTLEVGPVTLKAFTVPLIENGRAADPVAALRTATLAQLEAELAPAIAQSTEVTQHLAFQIAGPPAIRFGPIPKLATAKVDWNGGSAILALPIELAIGPHTTTARAELVLADSDIAVRGLDFADDSVDVLTKAIQALPSVQRLKKAYNFSMTVLPMFEAGLPKLVVRLIPLVCAPPIDLKLEFADLARIDKLVTASVKELGQTLIDCSSRKAMELLDGEKVDFFGLQIISQLPDDFGVPGTSPRLDLSFVSAQFSDCTEPPANDRIGLIGVKIDGSGVDFSLASLDQDQRQSIGRGIACRIRAATGLDPDFLEVSNVEIGDGLIGANLRLRNLPWVGDLVLDRINFVRIDKDIADQFRATAGKTIEAKLNKEIASRLTTPLQIAGVGTMKLKSDGVAVSLFASPREIALSGTLTVSDFNVPVKIVLPLSGNVSQLRVEIPPDAIKEQIKDQIIGMITDLLPVEGPVTISPPQFVRLDSLGNRWGFVFGVKVKFEMGAYPLELDIRRVAITQDRVELDDEIRVALAAPMYFGPVALSKVILAYHTGSDGGKKGISLGADITAVEPEFANVLKLEAILDLRDIDRLRFTLESNLIALNSMSIFEAFGEIELNDRNQFVAYQARTSPMMEKIIKIGLNGRIDGGRKLFFTDSELAILGLKLSESSISFCTNNCPRDSSGNGGGGEGRFDASVYERLLFGDGIVNVGTDLGFRDPKAAASIELMLFGWSPGGAKFVADLGRTDVKLRFLGIDVTVTTPSVETMTPSLILDVILSLLDIDLADLLKLKPDDIKISLLHGDGSVSDASDGNDDSDKDSEGGNDGDDGKDDPGNEPGPRTAKAPPGAPTAPPPSGSGTKEENGSSFAQKHWGTERGAYYCERIAGRKNRKKWDKIADDDWFDLWFRSGSISPAASPLYSGHAHSLDRAHGTGFVGRAAKALCTTETAPVNRMILKPDMIPVAARRQASETGYSCTIDGMPEIRAFTVPDSVEPEVTARYNSAVRPFACVKNNGRIEDVRARLFKHGDVFKAVILCPPPTHRTEKFNSDPMLSVACSGQNLLELGGLPGNGPAVEIISAAQELALFQRIRHRLEGVNDPPDPATFSIQFKGKAFEVHQYQDLDNSGREMRRRYVVLFPSTKPGFEELVGLSVSRNSLLLPWLDRPVFRDEILSHWLVDQKRPRVVEEASRDGILVLNRGTKGTHKKQLWLWETDGGLVQLSLAIPKSAPGPNGPSQRVSGPLAKGLYDQVHSLAKKLDTTLEWQLDLGRAKEMQLLLSVYSEKNPREQHLRILVDAVPSVGDGGQTTWQGNNLNNPPRAKREFCTNHAALAKQLSARLKPQKLLTAAEVKLALLDPEAYLRQLAPFEHPTATLSRITRCK